MGGSIGGGGGFQGGAAGVGRGMVAAIAVVKLILGDIGFSRSQELRANAIFGEWRYRHLPAAERVELMEAEKDILEAMKRARTREEKAELQKQLDSGQIRQVTGNDYLTALENKDVVAVIGTPLDFRLGYGSFGDPPAKVVHVNQ